MLDYDTDSTCSNRYIGTHYHEVYVPFPPFDIDWLPPFTMPPAAQAYRPKFTKPQWTPTATAPRRMLRCNRKGIGLRVKTTK